MEQLSKCEQGQTVQANTAQKHPTESELVAAGLSYPVSKEQAVLLWYEGFRSEPIPVLEAWEAIGHDIGCNPSKQELLDSLRNMAAICEAHGNDMPKPAQDVSGLVEALEAIVRQYPNPDITHVDYRVQACKQAEHALEAYRATLAAQGAAGA